PGREIAARPQLGDRQLDRADAGVPLARPRPIPLSRSLRRPLIALGPDLRTYLRFHQFVHQPAHRVPQKVLAAFLPLAYRVQKCHRLVSHRMLSLVVGLDDARESTRWLVRQAAKTSTPRPGTLSGVG